MMKKMLSWIIVVFWMVVIFYFSYQPATVSNGMSMGVTMKFIQLIEFFSPDIEINENYLNGKIRKFAHFFIYFLLGIFVMGAIRKGNDKGWRSVAFTFLICVLFAIFDEMHQLIVPGRGAQLKDVIIDSLGALLGISLYLSISSIKMKKRDGLSVS